MRVFKIPGEQKRYKVESTSLECPACKKLFPRLASATNAALRVGDQCPKCGLGKLDIRLHLVDLEACAGLGQCTCEHWAYNLIKKVREFSKERIETMSMTTISSLRCAHVQSAAFWDQIFSTQEYHLQQMKNAGNQTEEMQP